MADSPVQLKLQARDGKTELVVRVAWRTAAPEAGAIKKSSRSEVVRLLRAVSVQLNGKLVAEMQVGVSLADFPEFGFLFSGIQPGDRFLVSCLDDAGDEVTSDVLVSA